MLSKIILVAGVSAKHSLQNLQVEQDFMGHVAKYGLSYGTKEEYQFRLGLYKKTDDEIKRINSNQTSFTTGHNQFSTYTDAEYDRLLGSKGEEKFDQAAIQPLKNVSIPTEWDWRSKGGVNPVQNQGQCGSCWTFSATCSIESAHWQVSGELLKLAEQQIVDCDSTCEGCNGGYATYAMDYVKTQPQELESDYPYTAKDGACQWSASKGKVGVQGYKVAKPKSAQGLREAIAEQVVSIRVSASATSFRQYTGGIYNDPVCAQTNINHAINAVGYGVQNGTDYFIVRNSWGVGWGDQGYILMDGSQKGESNGVCLMLEGPSSFPQTN